ncbi:ATP-binding protein [Wenxinia marina]|nr:ATP-binding protein [Wenxinia marina]
MLDGFLGDQRSIAAAEADAIATVRSVTAEADAMRKDIEKLNAQLSELPSIEDQLAQLAPHEQQLAALSAVAQAKAEQLNALSDTISVKGVASAAVQRFRAAVAKWRDALAPVQAMAAAEVWPANAGADALGDVRTRVATAHRYIAAALEELAAVEATTGQIASRFEAEKIGYEDQARALRRDIEGFQTGAGDIARRGHALRERKAQLESLRGVLSTRIAAMQSAAARRSAALDVLEAARTQRYEARAQAANRLNQVLGPRIRVAIMRGGLTNAFAATLTDALRGSGLRYNDMVGTLAQRISPRELLEAVENDDYDLVATRGSLSLDRAAKTVLALKEADLGSIATVPVEDYVTFSLLDGADHKDIADLSTGQRCTVILPLVLRHVDRLLIVDQPEDHIDNAFIADTLIKAILARPANGQLIFSTHNANIPVLGNADFVVQLESDGRRGFPLVAAPLSSANVVQAISSVMEGGAEAFRRRAAFYAQPRL